MSQEANNPYANHTHRSQRNIPLIYIGRHDVPIVTMENYMKWYGIYVVHPNGVVENVAPDVLDELCGDDYFIADHNYHPTLLRRVAKHFNGEVDPVSLEVALGRWKMEIEDLDV